MSRALRTETAGVGEEDAAVGHGWLAGGMRVLKGRLRMDRWQEQQPESLAAAEKVQRSAGAAE